jgi:PPOX class probable F420-dependent enzyme
MPITIPNTHGDLFQKPVHGVLTTMMPDGAPQSSIVWVDYDGDYLLINTTLERQKGRNMAANPKVALLVIDPQDTSRWIEVRGHVKAMTADGAEEHADRLTQLQQTTFLSRYIRQSKQRNARDCQDSTTQSFAGCHFQVSQTAQPVVVRRRNEELTANVQSN